MQMLLAWDGGEIRKIIGIAQWTKDRLKLVQVAPSMRALIVCYNVSNYILIINIHVYINLGIL